MFDYKSEMVVYMKTIFIINPCAGQGNKTDRLIDRINRMSDSDVGIYITKAVGEQLPAFHKMARNYI